jgi:hypothetical protein
MRLAFDHARPRDQKQRRMAAQANLPNGKAMCGRHVLVDVLLRSTRLLGNAPLFNRAIFPQDNHGALR